MSWSRNLKPVMTILQMQWSCLIRKVKFCNNRCRICFTFYSWKNKYSWKMLWDFTKICELLSCPMKYLTCKTKTLGNQKMEPDLSLIDLEKRREVFINLKNWKPVNAYERQLDMLGNSKCWLTRTDFTLNEFG